MEPMKTFLKDLVNEGAHPLICDVESFLKKVDETIYYAAHIIATSPELSPKDNQRITMLHNTLVGVRDTYQNLLFTESDAELEQISVPIYIDLAAYGKLIDSNEAYLDKCYLFSIGSAPQTQFGQKLPNDPSLSLPANC